MIIDQVFQRKIHITEHAEAFTGDAKAVALDKLKQTIVGKCYMSCLILEIVEILRVSDMVISRHTQDASKVCSVLFKARTLKLEKHQPLHGCVIKNIDKKNNIVAEGEHVAVYIKADPAVKNLRVGQTIVAKVGNARYTPFASVISVNALPFVPTRTGLEKIVFKVTVEDSNELNIYIDRLKSVVDENKTLDRKFFDTLVHPRKNKIELPASTKIVSVVDLMKKKGETLYIGLPDYISTDQYSIIVFDEKKLDLTDPIANLKKSIHGMVVSENYISVMGSIIHEMIKYEDNIKQLCTVYSTDAIRKENSNIWDIYTKYKY